MANVTTNPEIQISDVDRTSGIRVWYTVGDDNHEMPVNIDPKHFNHWLEESNHLHSTMEFPNADSSDIEVFPCTFMVEEFWLLNNSFTHPVIMDYLNTYFPQLASQRTLKLSDHE